VVVVPPVVEEQILPIQEGAELGIAGQGHEAGVGVRRKASLNALPSGDTAMQKWRWSGQEVELRKKAFIIEPDHPGDPAQAPSLLRSGRRRFATIVEGMRCPAHLQLQGIEAMDEESVPLSIHCGDLDALVPSDHPLRTIRSMADEGFASLQLDLEPPRGTSDGHSVAAEKLLRSVLLQHLFAIPSERQLLERLKYDLLFRWFADIDGAELIMEHRTFSEHRHRLVNDGAAMAALAAVLAQPDVQELLAGDYYSADGSLFAVWAAMNAPQCNKACENQGQIVGPGLDQDKSNKTRASHDDHQDQVRYEDRDCCISFDVTENRSDHLTISDAPVPGQKEDGQCRLEHERSRDRFVGGHVSADPFCLLTIGVREQIALPSAHIGALHPDDRPAPLASGAGWSVGSRLAVGALTVCAIGVLALVGTHIHLIEVSRGLALRPVVDSIIIAESSGCVNAKNERSTALGPGQFLRQTWLELIRAYRPELAGLGEAEILELRRDPQLAREMTIRFAERNRTFLHARGLPVTPGSVYLSHFAGPGGAVAVLQAQDDLDAATVMANADASGRATRDEIVNANPFLRHFTVGDLKHWADGKMQRMRRNEAAPRQC
jgi:transposase